MRSSLSIAEVVTASASESEEDEDETADASEQIDGDAKRRRNRGKRSKKRNRREAQQQQQTSGTSTPDHPSNLGVPLSQASTRTASPKPAAPAPSTPLEKIAALRATLTGYQQDVEAFRRGPPTDPAKREFEHKKLSEMILTQVLLKLDAVETEGDADARGRRKELVRETQGVLQELDAFMRR